MSISAVYERYSGAMNNSSILCENVQCARLMNSKQNRLVFYTDEFSSIVVVVVLVVVFCISYLLSIWILLLSYRTLNTYAKCWTTLRSHLEETRHTTPRHIETIYSQAFLSCPYNKSTFYCRSLRGMHMYCIW